MSTAARTRMPADERRASIIAAATSVFAASGYAATTTARLAGEAAVAETILYRHFGSKSGLYIACIDSVWNEVRALLEQAFATEPDASTHWAAMGRTFLDMAQADDPRARLWASALTETTGDAQIDSYLADLMREVHAYVTDVLERSQQAGGVGTGRNTRAEAWIVISLGLLGTVAARLGPVVRDDMQEVLASHRQWITQPRGH